MQKAPSDRAEEALLSCRDDWNKDKYLSISQSILYTVFLS